MFGAMKRNVDMTGDNEGRLDHLKFHGINGHNTAHKRDGPNLLFK